jgi:hypothetical protein
MAKKLLSCWLLLGLLISSTLLTPIEVSAKSRKGRTTTSKRKSTVKRSRGAKSSRRQVTRSSRRGGSKIASNRRVRHGYTRISGPASAMPPERVREIQEALKREGYLQSESTGNYDKATVDAMSSYQRNRSLRVTGYPTAEALRGLGLTRVRRVVPSNTTGEGNVPTAPGQNKDSGTQTQVIPQKSSPIQKEPGQSN